MTWFFMYIARIIAINIMLISKTFASSCLPCMRSTHASQHMWEA
jgi:hypothetical protein